MALPFKIITQTPFNAVTLDVAKSQCRLMQSFTLDDGYIDGLILAAASTAQEYLHWLTSPAQVKQFSAVSGVIPLYGRFIKTIDEVTATDVSGEVVTLTSDDYSYNDVTEEITITGYTDINVTYSGGPTTDELPHIVVQGILMLISTMYNNREDLITGLSVEKMPLTSEKLLSKVRRYVS